MERKENPHRFPKRPPTDFPFVPRIINPIRVRKVLIFSSDEPIRKSGGTIQAEMPWVEVQVLPSPRAVSEACSDGATVLILDDVAMNLLDVEKIRQNNHDMVVVLLSFQRLVQCSPPSIAQKEFPYTAKADLVFAVNRNEFAPDNIITSVVRAAEDHLNIERCSAARRFIVLIVDDEPSWPSHFLPLLYEIIGQRAAVKITRTHEDTLKFLFGVENESEIQENCWEHGSGDHVVCLITDIFFPKGENINSDAGKDLIRLMNKHYPRIPIIIASKAPEARELAEAGFVLPKGDPGSLETLRRYFRDFTGIGDFVIHGEKGEELYRLKDLREIYHLLSTADRDDPEADSLRSLLETYAEKDKFSTWFYMHSLRELGDRLRPQKCRGQRMITVLKRSLKREMLRMNHTPLIVDGIKIFDLQDLVKVLRFTPPEKIQPFSDNDIISSWLDQKGYSELADALRPIHGKGSELGKETSRIVAEWIMVYQKRGETLQGPSSQ